MNFKRLFQVILLVSAIAPLQIQAANFSSTVSLGYSGGPGIYANAELSNFAYKFPFKVRLGAGYTSISDPGKPWMRATFL